MDFKILHSTATKPTWRYPVCGSALGQLQNAVAAAAAPLLEALAPALIKIIELATMAVTAIGQLFAALTGKGTVIKATNAYKDYAASLKKTGAAAKDATLGIDELNVIQKQSGSGASRRAESGRHVRRSSNRKQVQRPGGQDQRFLFEIICTSERSMEPGRSVRNGFLEVCVG